MELEAKKRALAEILDGKIVDDSERVEICIKGSVLGFPMTVEAFRSGFPFGVTYYIETETEKERERQGIEDPFRIDIRPRYARGILVFFSRLLLFESKGQNVGDKKFEGRYISEHTDFETAERFIRYPGVVEAIDNLNKLTGFTELVARAKYGLVLSQSNNFKSLDIDKTRETVKNMGNLAQVLFDAF